MNKPYYPKILIVSETFKSNTGGGITLSNLFRDYPKECLANAIDGAFINTIESSEICSNFYSLGIKEHYFIKPFHFLFKKYPSGKYFYSIPDQKADRKKTNPILPKVKKTAIGLINILGLNHILSRYRMSVEFEDWVNDFSPDFIYTQLGSMEMIDFANTLLKSTNAKLVIHIMDDWPEYIGKRNIFFPFWHKKVDTEFRSIINKASVLLSISQGMSEEYQKRYNLHFHHFHNPIHTSFWLKDSKNNLSIIKNNIEILYAGRIGIGIYNSILDIAKVIEQLNKQGYNISFKIQTTSKSSLLKKILKYECTKINPVASLNELPKIFGSSDILVMPIDFDKKSIKFLKYSMPTKASEYMISGTPILLYCSPEIYLVEHAKQNNWAMIVTTNKNDQLKYAILELINNQEIRTTLNKCAKQYAIDHFDSDSVRQNFQNVFLTNCH